jgi:DNA-directed RNA polymerase alpha subunit
MQCKQADFYAQRYALSLAKVNKLKGDIRSDDMDEDERLTDLITANQATYKELTLAEHGRILKDHVNGCKRCNRPPDRLTGLKTLFTELF